MGTRAPGEAFVLIGTPNCTAGCGYRNEVSNFADAAPQNDDMTLLVIEVQPDVSVGEVQADNAARSQSRQWFLARADCSARQDSVYVTLDGLRRLTMTPLRHATLQPPDIAFRACIERRIDFGVRSGRRQRATHRRRAANNKRQDPS
jgi:hypothetical protein